MPEKPRCAWLPKDKPDYASYHDTEWGVPVHGDQQLFEMLILEGAQAGLSWYTVLRRREGYRKAFYGFHIARCAALSDAELEEILTNGEIIRNRLKVFSVRKNALAVQGIQSEFGSLDAYLWRWVQGKPVVNRPTCARQVPTQTPVSDAISRELKKRGMSFVGSTIIYAFMQAVGMVNDHIQGCYVFPER